METRYLIRHTNSEETANKALAKGLNPEGSMIRTIRDPRRLTPEHAERHAWFAMIVDSTDGEVLHAKWLSDSEAMEWFVTDPMTIHEL